ncbi:hypothetical protein Z043_124990 [Scleropages formosus]|uniref:Fibronectin type-III domain-containing protein n=1 Tax=Scleropages formosus TaxID=113540 RepID=A0A0N8JV69_SCLFO|nr:hypothetical protein Z043_124990 [Scleropages formosus]
MRSQRHLSCTRAPPRPPVTPHALRNLDRRGNFGTLDEDLSGSSAPRLYAGHVRRFPPSTATCRRPLLLPLVSADSGASEKEEVPRIASPLLHSETRCLRKTGKESQDRADVNAGAAPSSADLSTAPGRLIHNQNVNVPPTEHLISNLEPFANYSVRVACHSGQGASPWTPWVTLRTAEGGRPALLDWEH